MTHSFHKTPTSHKGFEHMVRFRVWLASAATVFGILTFAFFRYAYVRYINAGNRFLSVLPVGSSIWVGASTIEAAGNVTAVFCFIASLILIVLVFAPSGRTLPATSFVLSVCLFGPIVAYTVYFATGSASITITGLPNDASAVVGAALGRNYRDSFLLRVPLIFSWFTWALTLALGITVFWRKPRPVPGDTATAAPPAFGSAQPAVRQTEGLTTTAGTDVVTQPTVTQPTSTAAIA